MRVFHLFEAVSDTADGFDPLRGFSHFFTQSPDMNIDGAVHDELAFFPDAVHDLVAGKNPPGMTGQKFQNIEFDGSQINRVGRISAGCSFDKRSKAASEVASAVI